MKVLVVGAGDGRHVLQSIADSDSNTSPEFYILEQNLMTYARQIIFAAMLQDFESESSQEVARMILELLGNVSIRKRTFDFVKKKSAEFIEAVASLDAKVTMKQINQEPGASVLASKIAFPGLILGIPNFWT